MREIGVAVPAHDEEQLLGPCLDAIARAATEIEVPVRLLVVLDDCGDGSAAVCAQRGVPVQAVRFRNAGRARRAGLDALAASCDWLTSTDADTRVAPDWLAAQLRLAEQGADAVFGVVDVDDWSEHSREVADRFLRLYELPDPHPHRHGANLGVRASTYLRVGGLPRLAVGEDQALARRLERSGASVVASTAVRVTTSARATSRVSGGFATLLASLA